MKIKMLFLLICLSITSVYAQELNLDNFKAGNKVNITLISGEDFYGTIVIIDNQSVVIKTQLAEIKINTIDIKTIENYSGKYQFKNSNSTRYFFAPTAIPIEKGKGYYQNLMLSSNFVNYGVTTNFSIGGGVELISAFLGYPIGFLSPKVAFRVSESFYVGGGAFGIFSTDGTAVALPFAVGTYGNTDNNITLGVGRIFVAGDSFSDVSDPLLTLSGFVRLSSSFGFMSENYLTISNSSMFLGIEGFRIMSNKNTFDLGVIIVSGAETPFPFVGYQRSF